MKIYGPYKNNYGRLFVRIKTENGIITQSYPRFLLEQKLNRKLLVDEDIHHIDGDCLNNDLCNLEIKKHGVHQKEHSLKLPLTINKTCCICGETFLLTPEQRKKFSRGKLNRFFCSRKCAGIYGREVQKSMRE